jgi:hypothetical protein
VFNSTTKFFSSALTLENHGNSTASTCKPYLLNPSTNHTITQIDAFSDISRVRGLLLTYADGKSDLLAMAAGLGMYKRTNLFTKILTNKFIGFATT